uniref:PH domain-containing protein n=1 Tax=Guillardia theta TaxID=55529 RepID=A0A7S4JAJ5_GUITH|mmetsp:Transcript_14514/g.49581  ORF Transcript_14514/g.49581 Transcript_14514/m.49581 type:complete len:283 (+) Transcript_14514:85-933(+)
MNAHEHVMQVLTDHHQSDVMKVVAQVVSGRLWFLDESGVWFNDTFIISKGVLRVVNEHDHLPVMVQEALRLDMKHVGVKVKPAGGIAMEQVKMCLHGSFSGFFYGQGMRDGVRGINIIKHDDTVHQFAVDTQEEQQEWVTSIRRLTEGGYSSCSSPLSDVDPITISKSCGMCHVPSTRLHELTVENASLRCALMAALDRLKLFSFPEPAEEAGRDEEEEQLLKERRVVDVVSEEEHERHVRALKSQVRQLLPVAPPSPHPCRTDSHAGGGNFMLVVRARATP